MLSKSMYTEEYICEIQNRTRNDPTLLERVVYADYYGAAEPPVRCGESHLSGLTEPPC